MSRPTKRQQRINQTKAAMLDELAERVSQWDSGEASSAWDHEVFDDAVTQLMAELRAFAIRITR